MKIFRGLFLLIGLLSTSLATANENMFKLTSVYIGIAEDKFSKEHGNLAGDFISVKGTPDGASHVLVEVSVINGQKFSYLVDGPSLPTTAVANENIFKLTSIYISIAEDMFEKEHGNLLGNFVSVRGKPDGSNVMVDVTLINGQKFTYLCMLMPDPMCHNH